jgi:hypothetical protein
MHLRRGDFLRNHRDIAPKMADVATMVGKRIGNSATAGR